MGRRDLLETAGPLVLQPRSLCVLSRILRQSFSWSVLVLAALATVSRASLPGAAPGVPDGFSAKKELMREQQLSEQMTEIAMAREGAPDFDLELARLSSRERQYREKLPGLSGHPRLRSVVGRVAVQPYRPRQR